VTEQEWVSCADPGPMLEFLGGKASGRKFRLFACACVRRVWPVLPQGLAHEVVRLSEEYADSKATSRDLGRVRKPARKPLLHPSNFISLSLAPLLRPDFTSLDASGMAEAVARFVGWECRGGRPVDYVIHEDVEQAEKEGQATLLRDLFGNPFRSVSADPAWLTPPVVGPARAVYDDRAFDRLPALADPLEEAGCRDADLLAHCRSAGPHVKGCWAVDRILGKT
jgi:hypothetical protein